MLDEQKSAGRLIARGILVVLLAGFAGATLVRLAPGFALDERTLDVRFSAETLDAIERSHAGEQNPAAYYLHFWGRLFRGDLGRSTVFAQSIGPLIRERAPITIYAVIQGLLLGWAVAMALATAAALSGRKTLLTSALGLNGAFLSTPSAVLAAICVLLKLSPGIAIAGVILPRVFPHGYAQLRAALCAPHVYMARARGLAPTRILLWHVLPATAPPLLSLLGVSITLACGAAIPVEALTDSPGLGQMAWRAALGRDLPVLVSITLLLAVVATFSHVVADLTLRLVRRVA